MADDCWKMRTFQKKVKTVEFNVGFTVAYNNGGKNRIFLKAEVGIYIIRLVLEKTINKVFVKTPILSIVFLMIRFVVISLIMIVEIKKINLFCH